MGINCLVALQREAWRNELDLYEINQWLWQFGLGKPRLGGLSVAETEELCIAVAKDGAKRAAVATLARLGRSRKAPKVAGALGRLELDIH